MRNSILSRFTIGKGAVGVDVSYVGPQAQQLMADIAKMLDERVLWHGEASHATRLLQEAREHNAVLRAELDRRQLRPEDRPVHRQLLTDALEELVCIATWTDRPEPGIDRCQFCNVSGPWGKPLQHRDDCIITRIRAALQEAPYEPS